MRILCTGGRDYADYATVTSVLLEYEPQYPDIIVVVGDARGADALVREWCDHWHVSCDVHYAKWDELGKRAGHVCNAEMLATKPDLVIAFPGGRGTANCVAQARKLGIPVREVQ